MIVSSIHKPTVLFCKQDNTGMKINNSNNVLMMKLVLVLSFFASLQGCHGSWRSSWKYEEASITPLSKGFVSGSATPSNTNFCVAMNNVPAQSLQVALDFACGVGGADCTAIRQGGPCFQPDTIFSHASYAFNSYYQNNAMDPGSCDFQGRAVITPTNPSYGPCIYPTSKSGGATMSSNNNTIIGGPPGMGYLPDSTGNANKCMPTYFLVALLLLLVMM